MCPVRVIEHGGSSLRKLIEKAVREHRDEQGQITGFMLIPFRDGEAMMTAEASDCDKDTQEVTGWIQRPYSTQQP